MSDIKRDKMWFWVLCFVNVTRVLAWTILVATAITYAVYLKEFQASGQFGSLASLWFASGLFASLVAMFLWISNYKQTAIMIKEKVLDGTRMHRIGYNLLAIYVLELFQTVNRWLGPKFAMEKTLEALPLNVADAQAFSFSSPEIRLSEKIPFITPVTEGMATVVLALVLIYWAKTIIESKRLQSELSGIV